MALACCSFKDPVIISAQIFSVIAFALTLWFTYLGTEICAALAMLLLLIAACRDIKVVYFYISIILNLLAIVGCILSIIFVDEFIGDDDDDDDEDSDDCDCYTEKGLRVAQGMAGLACLVTAALTWFFIRSGRYAKFHLNPAAQSSVHPAAETEEAPNEEKDKDEQPKTALKD